MWKPVEGWSKKIHNVISTSCRLKSSNFVKKSRDHVWLKIFLTFAYSSSRYSKITALKTWCRKTLEKTGSLWAPCFGEKASPIYDDHFQIWLTLEHVVEFRSMIFGCCVRKKPINPSKYNAFHGYVSYIHRVRKKGATIFFAITLPNSNRSSKFFYRHTQQ